MSSTRRRHRDPDQRRRHRHRVRSRRSPRRGSRPCPVPVARRETRPAVGRRSPRTMAGKERGFWYMPEVGDEALVAFELGDFDHPFVVGFLHNGVDTPPDDDIDREVRRMRTVSGTSSSSTIGPAGARAAPHAERSSARDEGRRRHGRGEDGRRSAGAAPGPPRPDRAVHDLRHHCDDQQRGRRQRSPLPPARSTSRASTRTVTASSTCTVTAGYVVRGHRGHDLHRRTRAVLDISGARSVIVDSGITMFSGVVQCSALVANAVVSSVVHPGRGEHLVSAPC